MQFPEQQTPVSRERDLEGADETWRQRIAWPLWMFIASRIVMLVVALLSQTIVVDGQFTRRGDGYLRLFLNWDAAAYLQIARDGYAIAAEGGSTLGYFPLYPLLVSIVALLTQHAAVAAMIVSNACLLGAGILLNELVRLDYPDQRIRRAAVAFLMFSPVTFFSSGAYVDSTFLLLALGALLAARNGNWKAASTCGLGLSLTHIAGVLILIPLAIEFARARRSDRRPLVATDALLLALIPLGTAAFLVYSHQRFGQAWPAPPPEFSTTKPSESTAPYYALLFSTILGAGVLAVAAGFLLRIRWSYLTYAVVLIVTCVATAGVQLTPRALSVAFPLFIALALLARRFEWSYEPLLAVTFVLLAFCTAMAANGYWFT